MTYTPLGQLRHSSLLGQEETADHVHAALPQFPAPPLHSLLHEQVKAGQVRPELAHHARRRDGALGRLSWGLGRARALGRAGASRGERHRGVKRGPGRVGLAVRHLTLQRPICGARRGR